MEAKDLKELISESSKVQIYKCGDKCVKVFKEPDEPKSVVFYEALTYSRVEETGYAKIPELIDAGKIDGKWTLVTKFKEGKTLETLIREDPAKRDEYLMMMADIQAEINSLRSPKLSRLKDYLKRSIEGIDMIEEVKKYELLKKLAAFPDRTCLCHGELLPENIIVGEDGTFVVDWLKAKQGNPLADAARTYIGFCLKHKTESAEKYLKLYCEKTKSDSKEIREWIPVIAAAQLKFKRPDEREFLLTWLDVSETL